MKLNLYDKELNRIAIIGDRFISVLWSEGYNAIQQFSLELQGTNEYKRKVKPECYVGRDDRKTLMVIKTVQIQNAHVIATGFQAARCLDDVPFIGTIKSGSAVAASIKAAYDSGDGYPGFKLADTGLTNTYDHQISNQPILGLCETMCQDTDVGFRAVRDGKSIAIEFYQPAENPNLILSEQYGNMTVGGITLSTQNWKNVAIVLGGGEGDARMRVDVDLSGGEQPRYLIVDARDLTQDEEESTDEYRARLAARGVEKLLECQKTWECSFTPLGSDFGSKYDLGDVLTVVLLDYDLKLKARVTRFTQKTQNNKTSTTIEVGNITITR